MTMVDRYEAECDHRFVDYEYVDYDLVDEMALHQTDLYRRL